MKSLLDVGVVKYCLPFTGIILPGLENQVYLQKSTMAFYNAIPYIGMLLFGSFGLLYFVTFLFGPQHDIELSLYYGVIGLVCSVAVLRISIILVFRNEVYEIIRIVNRNLLNPMQIITREISVKEKMKPITWLFHLNSTVQTVFQYSIMSFMAITKHQEVHPSMLPGNRDDPRVLVPIVVYNMIMGSCYVYGQTAFEWSLLAWVRLTTVEMQVLRLQINAIFSSIRYNENTAPEIRNNLNKSVLNDGKVKKDSDWLPVKNYREYYNEKIHILDQALNDWIFHHKSVLKLSRTIRKVYGVIIPMTYLFTIALSTSLILFSKSSVENDTFFLVPFACLAMLQLYINSYCDEECMTAGCAVVDDVLGMDWHLYPIRMQKKLLMILIITQRPLYVDAYGLGPLCMASFSSTVNFCYSLFSLLSSRE